MNYKTLALQRLVLFEALKLGDFGSKRSRGSYKATLILEEISTPDSSDKEINFC